MALANPNQFQKKVDAKLNITSMMDMFTIILVFLLFSFSTEKDPRLADNLRLPDSNAQSPYREAIKIVLDTKHLSVNDKIVAKTPKGRISKRLLDGDKVIPLFKVLEIEKEKIMAEKDKSEVEKTLVLFQADRNINFRHIDPVMKTSGMAGFPNFRFAVMKVE